MRKTVLSPPAPQLHLHQVNQQLASQVPVLSVVVACAERVDSLPACLDSLRESCAGFVAEIIVSVCEDASPSEIESRHPDVRVVTLPRGALVPLLWAEGISESRGAVVALTISQCTASREWAKAMINAINSGASAAGGPLVLERSASVLDAAVFFLRYSAFLNERCPPSSHTAAIAGDNSAYSRLALERGGWTREAGFWEVEVNELLIDRGDALAWVPEAVMQFRSAGSMSVLSQRRFLHGKLFGISRTKTRGESSLRIVLAAPLVPLVMLARAARLAWPNREYRRRLLAASPAFAWLSACWALGEAVGAIGAGFADRS